jgi:hypothetical protein
VEFNGPVNVNDLTEWLKKHPNAKPEERQARVISGTPDISRVKGWVSKLLVDGIKPPNRNKQWFTVGVEFALSGYSEDDTIDILRPYFEPSRTLKEKEWKTTIHSAFKWTYERKENV